MDDVRYLMEGLFLLPQRGKIHAYRKLEFCNCSRFSNRLVNGRAILFYQELTSQFGWPQRLGYQLDSGVIQIQRVPFDPVF